MNHRVLYIVGNGFDLHHQIMSSYSDFGQYVKTVDAEVYDTFEKHLSIGGDWANLEEPLGRFDVDWLQITLRGTWLKADVLDGPRPELER